MKLDVQFRSRAQLLGPTFSLFFFSFFKSNDFNYKNFLCHNFQHLEKLLLKLVGST